MVRSMMAHATLPITFWGHAIETAAYILNRVPTKAVPKTPLEMWNGRKPSFKHFQVWGCQAYVLSNDVTRLEPRSELCYFIGSLEETKGGLFYHPKEKKVFLKHQC